MNINLLKAKMVEKGINAETLAEKIGMARATMYRKLANLEKFTIGEAKKIAAVLNLTAAEACSIFLG